MMTWKAPLAGTPIKATVTIPGSKSLTNRALPLAALAQGATTIRGALWSRDTALMVAALRSLGTQITVADDLEYGGSFIHLSPRPLSGGSQVDCGLAGTVMRFVPAIAALATKPTTFDGDPHARTRPMDGLVQGLRALGAGVDSDLLPLTVTPLRTPPPAEITIDASRSSQFVSALLLIAPLLPQGLTVHHVGEHLPSLPHIDMTLNQLGERGVDARQIDAASWRVEPGEISGGDVVIEPDLSNAGPFLAAALAAGGTVSIPNWPGSTTQPGDQWRSILPQFGADVRVHSATLTVSSNGEITPISIDLSAAGELTPTVAALAALAPGESTITGIAHLRGHETDRLAALVAQIRALGGQADELADGLRIIGPVSGGALLKSYADHRMATFAAVVGLRVPHTSLDDVECTSKTLPDFTGLWSQMLAGDSH